MPVNKMLIEAYLKKLKMPQVAKTYESLAREAADNNLDYEEYLLCVLEQEYTNGKTIGSREEYDKRAFR